MQTRKKKQQQPSKAEIRNTLLESLFNPRDPGPFKVILDVGVSDYYLNRAIECIHSALAQEKPNGAFEDNVQLAISLLAIAKVRCKNVRAERRSQKVIPIVQPVVVSEAGGIEAPGSNDDFEDVRHLKVADPELCEYNPKEVC